MSPRSVAWRTVASDDPRRAPRKPREVHAERGWVGVGPATHARGAPTRDSCVCMSDEGTPMYVFK